MPEAPLVLDRLAQVAVNAKDLPRATAFWRDVLGVPFLFAFPGLAFFQASGVRFMLSRAEKPEFDHPASILYFEVDDVDAAHTALREKGVEFEKPPELVHRAADHELWMAFFHDSEGNPLALTAKRPLRTT